MKVQDVLSLPSMAETMLVAGHAGVERDVLWSHVVDMPDPVPWVRPSFFLLVSGYSWPADPGAEAKQIRALADAGVSAIGLAVPKYIQHFSDAAKAQADEVALPLIEIPWDVPFAQIMEELHRAVSAEPYRIIERSEYIHRELTRAAAQEPSLADLAETLGHVTRRRVVFEDQHGGVIAQSSVVPGREDGERIECPIRIGADVVGTVCIVEDETPLSELDRRAAEHAALIAAIQIAHQREIASLEARLGYASFLSLLESPGDVNRIAEERVRLLGFDAHGRYRVAIAVLPVELPLSREAVLRRDRVAMRVRDALRQLGANQLVTVKLNHVPFLLTEKTDPQRILTAIDDKDVWLALGRIQIGAAGVRESYREALSITSYAGHGRICSFDDVLVPRVIMGDAQARKTFLDDFFAPLERHKSGAQMTQALLRLARGGFRFRETAQALGIHPNTLRYRLDRATQLLNIDLEDPDVRFRLQLAARLVEMERPGT